MPMQLPFGSNPYYDQFNQAMFGQMSGSMVPGFNPFHPAVMNMQASMGNQAVWGSLPATTASM
jgi:hypothetical protein